MALITKANVESFLSLKDMQALLTDANIFRAMKKAINLAFDPS